MVPKKVQKFVELRLAVAKDKLKSARILLRESQHKDSVSRSYYAMFYAAKALILLKNYKKRDPKTHSGVMSLLGQYFIKTEEIDKSFAKIFSVVQEARHDADYEEKVKVTKAEAKRFLALSEKFVDKMKEVTNSYLKEKTDQ